MLGTHDLFMEHDAFIEHDPCGRAADKPEAAFCRVIAGRGDI
jgi:hypothetical protein